MDCRNDSRRDILNLERVGAAGEHNLVEEGQTGKFNVTVRGERALVAVREQRADIGARDQHIQMPNVNLESTKPSSKDAIIDKSHMKRTMKVYEMDSH